MYILTMNYVDDTVIEKEFAIYTEAIVALCAAINAAQYEGIFVSAKLTKVRKYNAEI